MTALAAVLLAIGGADLRHGLTGEPRGRRAVGDATALGLVISLGVSILTGQTDRATAIVVVVATTIVAVWNWLRWRRSAPQWPLVVIGLGAAVAVALDSRLDGADGGPWVWMWGDLDIDSLATIRSDRAALVIAAAVFITATGNSIVRLVLALDGVRVDEAPVDEVKGGRVIGPIERLVIFGAIVAGAATIAGFVVAAKSLLRFPELSEKTRVHEATEYVLIGSLASWGVALLAALIAASP